MTTRDGDGLADLRNSPPKYWYVPTAFVATTLVSLAYVSFTGTLGGRSAVGGAFLSLWLLGLMILAVLVYPALFLDAVYIRRISSSWRPKSWHYILVSFATTVVVFTIATVVYRISVALLLGIGTFVILTFLVCIRYLYQRHDYFGKS